MNPRQFASLRPVRAYVLLFFFFLGNNFYSYCVFTSTVGLHLYERVQVPARHLPDLSTPLGLGLALFHVFFFPVFPMIDVARCVLVSPELPRVTHIAVLEHHAI